ncbi:MAG: hypothetical protein AB1502_09210 [Thermodesulfobacteriota bacterium]
MDERIRLIEKLHCIEALFAGATTPGERTAAANALERMRARLHLLREKDPPLEFKFTMPDTWSRRLFVALLRRYGIEPFCYSRQRRTTVMAIVPRTFLDETLWPEFQELNQTLRKYLDEVTNQIIKKGIYSDISEPEVRQELPAK